MYSLPSWIKGWAPGRAEGKVREGKKRKIGRGGGKRKKGEEKRMVTA